MITLLIVILFIVIIAGIVDYIVRQLPGVPAVASAIVWLIALLIVLGTLANHFGFLGPLRC